LWNRALVDNLSTRDVKAILDIILSSLTNLINNVLKTGIFPDKLKETIVTQIHKKGDYHDSNNRRPYR